MCLCCFPLSTTGFFLRVGGTAALFCHGVYLAACGLYALDEFVPEYAERGYERDGDEQDDEDVLCHALAFLPVRFCPWRKIVINHIVLLNDELYSFNNKGVRFVKRNVRKRIYPVRKPVIFRRRTRARNDRQRVDPSLENFLTGFADNAGELMQGELVSDGVKQRGTLKRAPFRFISLRCLYETICLLTFPGICLGVSAVPVRAPGPVVDADISVPGAGPAADADTSAPEGVPAAADVDTSVPEGVPGVLASIADVL